MGGGDLNMKKSFHPHTMQNLERVWKAEQKRDQERKKIEQLRRELQEERGREEMHRHAVDTGVIKDRGDRLDWMYSGPQATVNHEEYLLGKKIDKAVDPFAVQPEAESSADTPGSMFSSSSGANSTVDLAAKIKEDPLFMMKKQEEQARKSLLRNPVRLKQLQEMLREQTGGKSSRKDKGKKKKKKKHRREHSSDEDERIPHRTTQGTRHDSLHRGRWSQSRDQRHGRRHSSDDDQRVASRSSSHLDHHSRSPVRRHRRDDSLNDNERVDYRSAKVPLRNSSHRDRHSESPGRHQRVPEATSGSLYHGRHGDNSFQARDDRCHHARSRSRSRSPLPKSADRQNGHRRRSRSRSPPRYFSNSARRRQKSPPRRRLDPQELERRRQQMVEDARAHDKERLDRIKQRREQADREELEIKAREASTDEQFIAPIRASALKGAAASTVEDRIHRNIHKIQRTKASLDRSFTER